MIISGTGIPASPLTKVKDALLLAVYFMGTLSHFSLHAELQFLPGQLAVLLY